MGIYTPIWTSDEQNVVTMSLQCRHGMTLAVYVKVTETRCVRESGEMSSAEWSTFSGYTARWSISSSARDDIRLETSLVILWSFYYKRPTHTWSRQRGEGGGLLSPRNCTG